MFGKIIPLEMLLQMPRSFVHRLRDIRIKQLEQVKLEQDALKNNATNIYNLANNNNQKPAVPRGIDHAMFNGTPMGDIIDELT